MDKTLKLYTYVDGGVDDTPFPNSDNPIEIGAFRYDAKRMGGAPTITASVNYPSCLDGKWTDNVYAKFNGEKYFLKQVPTSSYNNESTMYKHDLELVSERAILDDVYFFDAVVDEPEGDDKPVSNSTKVVFFGDIHEFAKRLQSSLAYSGIDYEVYVDSGVSTEGKLISFEDAFFSNVLQEIYNTYEQPYYFNFYTDEEGVRHKEIRIGKTNRIIEREFAYGVDDALLSITKANANYKIVNRATGFGSSDNIPFYYPNNSPKGDIYPTPSRSGVMYHMVDAELYANKVGIGDVLKYERFSLSDVTMSSEAGYYESGEELFLEKIAGTATKKFTLSFFANNAGKTTIGLGHTISNVRNPIKGSSLDDDAISCRFSVKLENSNGFSWDVAKSIEDGSVEIIIPDAGRYFVKVTMEFASQRISSVLTCNYTLSYSYTEGYTGWSYNVKPIELSDVGLALTYGTIESGDTITQRLERYVKTSDRLMPFKYRDTFGKDRFYNAINGLYPNPDATGEDDQYIRFNNPFVEGRPKEHIVNVDNIKPTIKGTEVVQPEGSTFAGSSLRIDMFSEFAYDDDDNDETYEDEEGNVYFKHPYFYGKLRVMDFNLFDHAIENQPMTISFTSGDCGACNFEIGVTEEYPQKNPVQVDEEGNLIKDENGMVVAGVEGTQQLVTEFQDRQQDTSKYEVWIALRKEEETYGILMPKAPKFNDAGEQIEAGHRPKAYSAGENDGDTFVILGINLPKVYITNAEKLLEAEIIKYIKDNNDEKFNFSIKFSRIFFAEEENKGVFEALNENAQITVRYNNIPYTLYVSSYSYSMNEGETLPEISVELSESLSVSQNALQNAVSEIKGQIKSLAYATDTAISMQKASYIQKQADDEAHGLVNFTKGIKFGEGGQIEILDNNSAKLTIEYLEVTKKASFTSLEIQEKTHVGGQLLVTPAAINCGEVEVFDDFYRCYFQTKGTDGEEIFNQFAEGDQAICQTYNAWGSRYYWRLVVGVGEDYIDLSMTECDEGSGEPNEGDRIIQLGNQIDKTRQNAIVIAAYGDGSPYFIQYSGIKGFSITSDNIVTKFSPDENIVTGKMKILAGSSGDLNAGNQNLLRNSGFTGDYVSEALVDKEVMEAKKQLFSDPLDFWKDNTATKNVEVIDLVGTSASGKGAKFKGEIDEFGTELSTGMLAQTLYYDLVGEEAYTLSFKAKGFVTEYEDDVTGEVVEVHNSLRCTVGDTTSKVILSDDWERYIVTVNPSENSKVFSLEGAIVEVCDIQLERGLVATAWNNSFLDNSSDRTYWQSMKYLQDGLAKEAVKEGSTEVYGGLILTNAIKVGNYANQEMIEETAGMSGKYAAPDSPAFWAGGDIDTAIATAAKYQTSTETPEGEISYVVTHGGKVVLNDAIVRGKVYASGGKLGENTTIENDIIKTNAIELSDYVVYRYRNIENACNGGAISESYHLHEGASSYILFSSQTHQGMYPSLEFPPIYEEGRQITIVCTPFISSNDATLTLLGNFFLMSETEEGQLTPTVSSITMYGGKIELLYANGYWMVLSPVAKNWTLN